MGDAVVRGGGIVTARDHERTLQLLRKVLPHERWADGEFLEWAYESSPAGQALISNIDEGDLRLCHTAGLPFPLRDLRRRFTAVLLINGSTLPEVQYQGAYPAAMLGLAEQAERAGIVGGFGVTNRRATTSVLKGTGAAWQCSLPVKICLPWKPSRGVEGADVTPELLAGPRFAELTQRLGDVPARHATYCWSTELLRWRLSMPGARYALHWTSTLLCVSTRTVFRGVPITVILKLLPREGQTGPLSPSAVITAACRHHRTPVALYAGINAHVPVTGIRLSQDRLPAPLNLVTLSIDESAIPQEQFVFGTFEFLEFDAF